MLVAAQQHLGIRAELPEVVDLAVERERDSRGGVHHRLVPALGIDDREPPVAEEHAASIVRGVFDDAAAVGAAMRDTSKHALDDRAGRARGGRDDGAGDAAHADQSFSFSGVAWELRTLRATRVPPDAKPAMRGSPHICA